MSSGRPYEFTREAWHMYQIRRTAATNYNLLPGHDYPKNNLIIDDAIFGLLVISLGCVLDYGLKAYIKHHALTGPKNSLKDRIDLAATNATINSDELHKFRLARNDEAHVPTDLAILHGRGSFTQLGKYESLVGETLVNLDVLEERQIKYKYEWYWVMEQMRFEEGRMMRDVEVGVKRDGKPISTEKYTIKWLKDGE